MPRTKNKLKRIKGIKNKHLPTTIYVPSSLSKQEKEAIREIKEHKKYPDELKPNYWILNLSARNKKKVIKYMNNNNKLVCTRIELEKLIKR